MKFKAMGVDVVLPPVGRWQTCDSGELSFQLWIYIFSFHAQCSCKCVYLTAYQLQCCLGDVDILHAVWAEVRSLCSQAWPACGFSWKNPPLVASLLSWESLRYYVWRKTLILFTMFLALKSEINYVMWYSLPAPHFLHSSFPIFPSSFFPFLLTLGINSRTPLRLKTPPVSLVSLIYLASLLPWPGDLVFATSH